MSADPEQPSAWAWLDATAQAELVRSGEATPRALVEAACDRIERFDGQLGAVPVRFRDEALASLENLDRDAAFAGVPFLMKDVGARQAGQPYHAGNQALRAREHRADDDTVLGTRFRELGLVTVGNSNTPEFGLQSNTWPLAYGPTHNPWNPKHSAGGSSGGACAAVAAGLVPVAHASDGAGSIRIPAAWCGLVGLKPSRDRVLWRHAGTERPDVEFVVARSLRDTARFLDLLRRRGERRRAADPYASALAEPPAALRVALCVRSPAGNAVDPECVAAVERVGRALEGLGHAVEEAAPPTLFEYGDRALHGSVFGFLEYQECLEDLAERLGREIGPEDVEPFLWDLATTTIEGVTHEEAVRSEQWIRDWTERTRSWFDEFDVLVTPTVGEPAPPLSDFDPHDHAAMELLEKMLPHMAFTEPWNATGQPAISLPLGWSERTKMPIGVQMVAALGRDDRLIALAGALFETIPPAPHRPMIHA